MTSWLKLVETNCATNTNTQTGIGVKAKAILLQYTHAVDLVCLQNTANDWCFLKSQTWVGSDYVRYHTAIISGAVFILTCTGQVVQPPLQSRGCNTLSDQYHVSTGDMRVITNNFCNFNTTICLPLPCEIKVIEKYGETCVSLTRQSSNSTHDVTHEQFMNWNPNLLGSCDGIALGQRICTSSPGGLWVSNSTIISPPNGVPVYLTTDTPAWPTQSGSIANCGRYHEVVDGDTCNLVCLIYGITFATLRKFNTYLNAECTNLWLKSSACVGEVAYQQPISMDGACGVASNNATCTGSAFGGRRSAAGWWF